MVYLLSSCDEDAAINEVTGKPEMIMYYNQTKGGVDTLDQMCSLMSCSRKTNRWPMSLFYGMLNIAFVNAYITYRHNVVTKREKPLNRRKFMKHLSMALTSPYMAKRLEAPTLKRYLRDEIKNTLPKAAPGPTEDDTEEPNRRETYGPKRKRKAQKKRTYCAYCPSKIKRKASGCCKKCKKVTCREHNIDMCLSCI